jgi:alpha-methylacyl-CoA racemase
MSVNAEGPLSGTKVVEFAAIGPGPFAAMLLGDWGAEVLTIERPGTSSKRNEVLMRNRGSMLLDLKDEAGHARAVAAVRQADVMLEGFRPGVMERLALGPEAMLALNPRLIYGRITGWGQEGPLAHVAGHDINYTALAGGLLPLGPGDRPPVPALNIAGDYAGGTFFLCMGVLAALVERNRSGKGQVVDAAIIDGVASMMGLLNGYARLGAIDLGRGGSLSGDAPNFRCYDCADGGYVAVGCIEPRFYDNFCDVLAVPLAERGNPRDRTQWPALSARFATIFSTRSRDAWVTLFADKEACVAPVLSVAEAAAHEQLALRGTYQDSLHPAPAPRFSRTPGSVRSPAPSPGEGGLEMLARWAGKEA